jgi:glycosyltransferase involved in cell wall biosynthesis
MPRVSIITPTVNRQGLLPVLWGCVRAQSVEDFEWLVLDGSPDRATFFDTISDPRVSYRHAPAPMSIGERRNALCRAANGEIIAQFDDDDFYARHYIEGMLSLMEEKRADFVKLFGFFLYHRQHEVFAYWDLALAFPLHYRLHPSEEIQLVPYSDGGRDARWGYGFSYVFHRRVWETERFLNQNHGEDQKFADAAVARFNCAGKQDRDYSCVHVIHTSNTSFCFPQQVWPKGQVAQLFPGFS